MSDEYTIAGNFQRTDDPRAMAEYEYRMGRVREREADLESAFDNLPAGRGATRHDPQISTPVASSPERPDERIGQPETRGGESGVPADAQEEHMNDDYEHGYRDGESNVEADIEFCVEERLGLVIAEGETWSVPLLRLKQERDRLQEDYLALLVAHPDKQYEALQEYLRSNDGAGARTIDAARQVIGQAKR